MEHHDLAILDEMREAISSFIQKGMQVGELADRLVFLRDNLEFDDPSWFYALTQEVATLDSASTFLPSNIGHENKLQAAVEKATNHLLELIRAKVVG